ncbi:MAG: heavy metal translocating P-type ATPase [Acidimicrobiales bacterium]
MSESTRSAVVEIPIEGMSCGACASRIETELAGLSDVSDARVNFATGRATVQHGPSVTDSDLEETIEGLGYGVIRGSDNTTNPDSTVDAIEASAVKREADLRRRLVVAVVLSVPTMALSMISALQFSGYEWVVGALATPVVFWSGWSFHRNAVVNLKHRASTMDTLVSLGSLASWLWSAVVLVVGVSGGHIYFETGAMIVTLILAGKWLEHRATRRSGNAIRALAGLGVSTVRLEDGSDVSVDSLAVGARFMVRPGERIATDGVVVDGSSAVDTAMITGESVPVEVGIGDEVIGATINVGGSLIVEAKKVGADTALAQIIKLVEQAQGSRAAVQRLADRVSAIFVPAAMAIALLTLIGWFLTGHAANEAFTAAVAVLIIACPCALGLATPLGIMVGTGRGAQLGVIIKGGEVLEDTRAIEVIVLDKTGTATEGRMALSEVITPQFAGSSGGADQQELLRLAASLEARSEHPIAQAISSASPDDSSANSSSAIEASSGHGRVEDFANHPGFGVSGTVDGVSVAVGRRTLFDDVPPEIEQRAAEAEQQGATAVLAGRDRRAEMVLVVTDRIKPTSAAAVTAFHDLGLSVTLLTGDNRQTAESVGAAIGVDTVIAEVLPEGKAAEIERLQAAGHRVAMVGDGINDAPALAQADLGIAVGTGTDVAIEASDLTVVSGDLRAVADAIALARRTLAVIRGNLFWAFAYNAAAIPLAAFGVLNPMIAAGAMGISSLFVASNSLRLRRFAGYRPSVSS